MSDASIASGQGEAYLSPDFIRNTWYVAAWDHEVGQDGMFTRTLLGEPVVFYRDSAGRVVALADKCPHRAAPLSMGRKEGDSVRCMYHGLLFNPRGQCTEIPGQERIAAQHCVKSYPVVERDRFIWIWMGDPAQADESQILDFHWHQHPEWRMKPGYIHYQAHYQLVVDNLLDFSHLSYLHPTTLGTMANAQTRAQIDRITEGPGAPGLRITRWYINDEMSPNHQRVATFSGKVDRWQIYEWHAPAFMRMNAGSAPAGTGAPEGKLVPEALQFRHTSVQTPETAGTTHYFFCQAHHFMLDRPDITEAIFQDVVKAFGEDRDMIEAQQRVLSTDPHFHPAATAHDTGLNQARVLLRERLQQEQAARRTGA
jgi:phenylpropionate dioxygenase-like ring-hydroxylating dioxygenase large terminal subunit